ncbi:Fic family protein [Lysinibacillus fusiformis]|uniref:Fic family protein n=1 Tax=Lysinibacillus fusiformis TaxID=28031 RepID=UPI001E5D04CC|nr:Fic family protein [Lysinibacillus fusiformis]MCE4045165.1 Fic family protein [Lysinibacillus fusiformis]
MDKFNFNREQMILSAQKNLIHNIYNSARLENVVVTPSQVEKIIEGIAIAELDSDDLQIILNLYNAWSFLLNHLDYEMSLDFACNVNNLVSFNESLDWGKLRYGDVGINGVNFEPSIPVKEEVQIEINNILSLDATITHKAITYMLYGMRNQLFWDGNKRTSIICANKLLIEHGKGLITIPEKHISEFHTLLSHYYETNESDEIYHFIYNKCLYA